MTNRRKFVAFTRLVWCFSLFLCFAILGGIQQLGAQVANNSSGSKDASAQLGATPPRMRGTTMAQRKAAAAHAAQRRAANPASTAVRRPQTMGVHTNAIVGQPGGAAMQPGDLYFSGVYPNYANSPLPNVNGPGCVAPNYCGIRKFIDGLPGLTTANQNTRGQYIPIAVADTTTFPGDDYYEISLVQYQEKLHVDLAGPTWLRGYVQTNGGTGVPHYLGPLIIAHSGKAVRIKFTNNLPTGTTPGPISMSNGRLFIPTDSTVKGSGIGVADVAGGSPYLENRATIHMHGGNTPWISDGTPHQFTVPAGNFTDGSTLYPRGASVAFVPDMFFHSGTGVVIPKCSGTVTSNCSGGTAAQLPTDATNDPGNGSLVFYYTNQQSARLLFYHDHAYGTTRLNVYAGEAAGFLIQDDVESDLVNGTDTTGVFTNAGLAPARTIPAEQIPLIIQDKTFVPPSPAGSSVYSIPLLEIGSGYTSPAVTISGGGCSTPPTATATAGLVIDPFGQFIYGAITGITITNPGAGCTSDPTVAITDSTGPGTGAVAYASLATLQQQDPTWDTTLWGGQGNFWYPHVYMPNQFPDNPDGSAVNPMGRWDYASWFWPVFTNQYKVRGDIPCGNTIPYSTWVCPGTPSEFNPAPILDLAGHVALGQNPIGQGGKASLTPEAFMDTPLVNGTAYPTLTVDPKPLRFRILSVGNDRTLNLSWFQACGAGSLYTATASAVCPVSTLAGANIGPLTEVGMVPATPTAGFPVWWPTDGRDGGVPDPAAMGPSWIQIGNEGGVLPAPAVIPPAPINYEYNRRSVTVTNTSSHSLNLMPAERADVIVDFTNFTGRTLILYNDAPAPYPAFDSRYDYYTGDPDQTGMGGAPTTLPGFGPNTRTIMQVVVRGTVQGPAEPAVNMANLAKLIPQAFKLTQPIPVVPEPVYSAIYNPTPGGSAGPAYTGHYPHLADTQMTFSPIGATKVAGILPTVTLPMRNKTIQELFELDFGRMNATLGTELALTNFNTQTTIPLGYVDPFTEDIYDTNHAPGAVASQLVGALGDGSQIWEVIHNGVDSHAIHFHLYNVQVLDRVGWDGTVRAPDPNELGWKDTVRMNPLEIDFVALRPMSQDLPFPVPDSSRLLDVTRPAGPDPDMSAFNPLNTNTSAGINSKVTMGWEYVWHCHILGHEENDMMREQTFQVPPQAPAAFTVVGSTTGDTLTFTDMALSETGFNVERADDSSFTVNHVTTIPDLPAQTGWKGTVSWTDTSAVTGNTYYYRVRSFKPDADYWNTPLGGAPLPNLTSAWVSNSTTFVGTASVNPTSLAFGNQYTNTTSAAKTITLTNIGLASLVVSNIAVVGTNFDYFAQSSNCITTLAPAASCTINVTFTPKAIGADSLNLQISSTDPATPTLNVPMTGLGVDAIIGATPTSETFGNQVYGTTSFNGTAIRVSSTGTIPLVINSITIGGANPADFTRTTTCGATLAIGSTCTISVRFAPQAVGVRNATVAISSNDIEIPVFSVTLRGTGTAAPLTITASSAQVAVGAAKPTINPIVTGLVSPDTVASLGGGLTCTTTYATASPAGPYPSTCSGAVDANYTFTYVPGTVTAINSLATVTPNAATKVFGATDPVLTGTLTGFAPADNVTATYSRTAGNAVGTYTISAVLSGSNLGSYTIVYNTAAFTITKASTTTAITAHNPNPTPLGQATVIAFSVTPQISGTPTGNVTVTTNSGETCTGALTAGAGLCSLIFKAAGAKTITATYAGDASFTGSASAGAPHTVSALSIAVSPLAEAFGGFTVGTTSFNGTAITVRNAGAVPITSLALALGGANPADFTFTTNCGTSLAVGASCSASARFAPKAVGARSATLNITSSDPLTPLVQVSLTGTGK